jgi:multiple sugar transport system substrate-binding protein
VRKIGRAALAASIAVPLMAGTGAAQAQRDVSFMVFGDPAELAAYQGLVDAFEAGHPDIDVELIHVADQGDYRQRLAADFAAGTPADIVLINYRRYAQFAARGVLEPLGDRLRESTLVGEADFYEEALSPFRWNGELLCIPQNLSSLVVYYNKAAFDAAGLPYPTDDWTWDEFLATAQALTLDTDGDGTTDQHGLGTEATIFRVAPFIWQNGGELVLRSQSTDQPFALAFDTPATREAIQWFVDLQVVHHVVPDAVEEAAMSSEDRFQAGTVAMFLNSRRGVPAYREIDGFDWDVAALPTGTRPAGILHSDAYCMPTAARDKDATWSFIEFANSPEGQAIIAQSGRTVPSLREVAESGAFLDPTARPANSQVFLSTLPVIRAVPVMPTWVDIEELTSEEIEHAYYGDQSVDEAIANSNALTAPFFTGSD